MLAVADMPASAEIGQALYAESQKAPNYSDKWLGRAFYIAGDAASEKLHRRLSRRSQRAAYTGAAGVAPDWEHQAGLAHARQPRSSGSDWAEHAGAGQLGIARPA